MVGGSSAAHQSLSQHSRYRNRISILALIVMFVLETARLVDGTSAASEVVSMAVKGNDFHKLSLGRSISLSPKLHNPTAMTQFHRHLLARGASAIGSTGSVDNQAVRALVGSSPPKCIKKCGTCTPCKGVLVPIHTNSLPATTAEYYPEAWRCQCKGKLYNP